MSKYTLSFKKDKNTQVKFNKKGKPPKVKKSLKNQPRQRSEKAKIYKKEQKREQTAKRITAKKRESASSLILSEFKKLIDECKSGFSSAFACVYSLDNGDIRHLAGDFLLDNITVERYFSFESTVVLRNPNGFYDNSGYKSRFITQFTANGTTYLICVGSFLFEDFKSNGKTIIATAENCRDSILQINTGDLK